jgi:acylglycerol lipase
MSEMRKQVLCAAAAAAFLVGNVGSVKAEETIVGTDAPAPVAVAIQEINPVDVELPNKAAFCTWADPSVKPWATVLAVHGLGFHKETYGKLARKLARLGIVVYAIDVRGFGVWQYASDPKVNFDLTFEDIKEGLQVIRERNKGLPVFLMGESMGGSIALHVAAKNPELMDGVIASVPAGNSRYTLPTVAKMVAAGLVGGADAQIDIGKLVIENATESENVKQKLLNDPKQRRRLRVRDLMAFRKLAMGNKKAATQIDHTPILIVQGYKDRLVSPKSIIKVFNKVKTDKKGLVLQGQSSHLVLEEGQFDDTTLDTVVSWIDKYSDNSPVVTASEMIKLKEQKYHRPIVDKPGIQPVQ